MNKYELSPIKLSLVLFIITALSGLILSYVYSITQPRIIENLIKKEEASIKIIMPDVEKFDKESDYYVIYNTKNILIGYIFKTEAKGYGGLVKCNVGINMTGKITGIVVTHQKETPGLGTKIVEVKKGEMEAYYLKQFKNKQQNEINLDSIETITSATISSKAVIECVKFAFQKFANLKK